MNSMLRKINVALFVVIVFSVSGFSIERTHATTAFLYRPYYGDRRKPYQAFDHKPTSQTYPAGATLTYNYCSTQPYPFDPDTTYDEHRGVDFPLTYEPVVAAAAGTIEWAGWSSSTHTSNVGLAATIQHGNGYRTIYGHLSMLRYSSGAVVGQYQIGTSGNTGWTSYPHLHFETRLTQSYDNRIDPYGWDCQTFQSDPFHDVLGLTNEYLFVSSPAQTLLVYSGSPYYVENGWSRFSKGCSSGSTCNAWVYSTPAGYLSNHYWTYANGTAADYWAKWTVPVLPDCGQYEVEVHVPTYSDSSPSGANSTRADAVRYEVVHQNGSITVVVDQHLIDWTTTFPPNVNSGSYGGTGEWISLGRYDFTSNSTSQYVRVTDASYFNGNWALGGGLYIDPTNKKVLADAVRWRKTH